MVGTGIGAEGTGTETHAGKAAPGVLEEAIMIGVQVRMFPFHSGLQTSLGTERDRRDYRYDDRRDSDRRDRDDRRRDERRDDRDHHRDDPRDRDVPQNPETKPPPGLKEVSGKHWGFTTLQYADFASSPPDSRTTDAERRSRE